MAPAPMAVAQASPVDLPNAVTAAPASAAPSTSSSNATTVTAAPLPKVVPPSSDADYLNNPKPAYPRVSKSLNEQGTVMVSVFIGTDGNPQKVELKKSSGFDRLDKTALEAVRGWRFVPGSRGGVPEAMWVVVPIPFVLTK